MNTAGLAKHYQTLSPRERLTLILAAAARGDEEERSGLVKSAPRLAYEVQDHFGLARAFFGASAGHLLRLLDLAVRYIALPGAAVSGKGKEGDQMQDAAFLLGHLIQVHLAGWRQFCDEHQFDPQVFWSRLPGCDTIKLVEETAEGASFTAEGARQYAQRSGWDLPLCRPPRVSPRAWATLYRPGSNGGHDAHRAFAGLPGGPGQALNDREKQAR
jgi:hypothetical protein